MDKVAKWLTKIYPTVQREINDANNSHVFKNYHPIFENNDANAKLLQTIDVFSLPENSSEDEVRITKFFIIFYIYTGFFQFRLYA